MRSIVRILIGAVCGAVVSGSETALADWFQLVDQHTGAYIGNAEVQIKSQTPSFYYTDDLGRFNAELAPGTYRAQVSWFGRVRGLMLTFDDAPVLKVITVN